MRLNVREINNDEKSWFEKILSVDFKGRNIIEKQLKEAKTIGIYEVGFISLKLVIENEVQKFPYLIRVPVEIRVKRPNKAPTIFLLHIIEGIIDELEIFNADSSSLDDIKIDDFEAVVNDNLKV